MRARVRERRTLFVQSNLWLIGSADLFADMSGFSSPSVHSITASIERQTPNTRPLEKTDPYAVSQRRAMIKDWTGQNLSSGKVIGTGTNGFFFIKPDDDIYESLYVHRTNMVDGNMLKVHDRVEFFRAEFPNRYCGGRILPKEAGRLVEAVVLIGGSTNDCCNKSGCSMKDKCPFFDTHVGGSDQHQGGST